MHAQKPVEGTESVRGFGDVTVPLQRTEEETAEAVVLVWITVARTDLVKVSIITEHGSYRRV